MSDTADRLLDAAQALVQTRGFNAFSFRDLATELDITNAGVHYHFPSKARLGEALVRRYSQRYQSLLAELNRANLSPPDRLARFVGIYAEVLREGRFCLCGMLASDAQTLPELVVDQVRVFFAQIEMWLADVLSEGRESGALAFEGEPADEASLVLASVQGALLTAWPMRLSTPDDARRHFDAVTRRALGALTPR